MDSPQSLFSDLDAQADHATTGLAAGGMIWRMWGEGPPLVLLHGGHGSWKHWLQNIPVLARKYRVYVPNLPGMGGSAPVGETIEEISAAVAAALDELGLSENYFLAGFSFGSIVAAYILDAHQTRVRHLFIVGTAGFGKVDMVTGELRRWQETSDVQARRAIHAHNLSRLMLHRSESIDDLAIDIQADNAEHTQVNNRKAALAANMGDCLDRHPNVPVTAIWGAEDVLVRRHLDERVAYLERRRPPGRSVIVPTAGHWVQYEAAEAVNRRMLDTMEAADDVAGKDSEVPHA